MWFLPFFEEREEEDFFGFEGWWDGNIRKQDMVSDLIDLYGNGSDDYLLGRSAFDVDIWHVDFPLGPKRILEQSEIDEIMASLGLSGNREAMVRGALEAVGNYYYAPSDSARNSAFVLDHGPSDEAGFIDHIFRVNNIYIGGTGTLTPWATLATDSAPGYDQMHNCVSNRNGTIEPGDILINPEMDMTTHTGKMLVVVKLEGNGAMVVDCTNANDGTDYHFMSYDTLADYTLRCNY